MSNSLLASLLFVVVGAGLPAASAPEYSIQALRYGTVPGFPVAELVMGAPKDEKIDMVVWLIRGGGRNILFDSGFHREKWFKDFPMPDFMRPDEVVKLAGVKPEEVTDIVVSHAHWDHMGGIDLFPKATVWIQQEEFRYYTGEDQPANIKNQARMIELAGSAERVVPGHGPAQFQKFHADGRIARIK